MYDIVIKNGFLIDGSGKEGKIQDIGIIGKKIVKISSKIDDEAKKVVDASNRVVTPGFIDPHVHEEIVCFIDGRYEHFLKQGVTTVVNNNCGHSFINGSVEELIDYYWENGLFSDKQRDEYKKSFPKWDDFKSYTKEVEKVGTNLNFVSLLGHGSIRWLVMNGAHDRVPTEEEWKETREIIEKNMKDGAWGISFGLDYVPSRYAKIDEIVEVAKIIKEYDGVVSAHLRNYVGAYEGVKEFIEVGVKSGAKLQFSHLKPACVEGFNDISKHINEGKIDALIDTIPRSTGHLTSKSRLIQFIMAISDDFFGGCEQDVKDALRTKDGRDIIKKDAYIFAGDKSDKYIVLSEDKEIEYMSVKDIAEKRGIDPDECMLDLIGDDKDYTFWLGGPSRKDFPNSNHPKDILDNPYVCVGTDEIMGDPKDPYDWYELQRRGGFPIFFKMYLEEGVAIEEIVRRNTSMVANHFGIKKRGQLKEGFYGDVSVINIEDYSFPGIHEIDYKKPTTTANGVDLVVVNGEVVLEGSNIESSFPGKVLKKGVGDC